MPTWGRMVQRWDNRNAKRVMWKGYDERARRMGKKIKAIAQQLVPVDTGYLQSTIFYRYRAERHVLEIGARAFYAAFVEFGTSRMEAQPYIRPAVAMVGPLLGGVISAVYASERQAA
jgi:HK97 gp10 family phage protein